MWRGVAISLAAFGPLPQALVAYLLGKMTHRRASAGLVAAGGLAVGLPSDAAWSPHV